MSEKRRGFPPTPAVDRIFKDGRVRYEGGCWIWTLRLTEGYGSIGVEGKHRRVHRVVYEALVGPIPLGMQIDHLCRERRCCNPTHMEIVTQKENILRGAAPSAQAARRDRCPKGHEYTRRGGRRYCTSCRTENWMKNYHLKRQANGM